MTLSKFKGLNNVASRAGGQEGFLDSAINVDVDDGGAIRTRAGYARVYGGGGSVHSLFSDGTVCVFREGSELKKLTMADGWGVFSAISLMSGIQGQRRMWYASVNGRIYFSDGATSGIIEGDTVRRWGVEPPPAPVLDVTFGKLPQGTYTVYTTYETWDGRESGASPMAQITPGKVVATSHCGKDESGITITVGPSADAQVRWVNIYVTDGNGKVPRLKGRLPNEPRAWQYRGGINYGRELGTLWLSPPPPSELITWYKGRMYVVSHNTVWYSQSYEYELFDLADNWIAFDGAITMLAAMSDGLYVGTAFSMHFLQGDEPEKFKVSNIGDCGAIYGTEAYGYMRDDKGVSERVVLWDSHYGMCAGHEGGVVTFLTRDHYSYFTGEYGAGAYIERDGMTLYVSSTEGEPMPPLNLYTGINNVSMKLTFFDIEMTA